jgi:hypothetical protein
MNYRTASYPRQSHFIPYLVTHNPSGICSWLHHRALGARPRHIHGSALKIYASSLLHGDKGGERFRKELAETCIRAGRARQCGEIVQLKHCSMLQ